MERWAKRKPACGVPVLHLEDAVHADGGPGLQPRLQQAHSRVPQLAAQAATTELGPHDEQAHEAERAVVADDGAAADELVTQLGRDEGLGVRLPEDAGVVESRVPALVGGPAHESGGFGLGHQA